MAEAVIAAECVRQLANKQPHEEKRRGTKNDDDKKKNAVVTAPIVAGALSTWKSTASFSSCAGCVFPNINVRMPGALRQELYICVRSRYRRSSGTSIEVPRVERGVQNLGGQCRRVSYAIILFCTRRCAHLVISHLGTVQRTRII